MDCRQAEELFSDDVDGTLHPLLKGELDQHLSSCADCRPLSEIFRETVATLIASRPRVGAPEGLALRAAQMSWTVSHRPPARSAVALPRWLMAAAAGLTLATTLGILRMASPGSPSRFVSRARDRATVVGAEIQERRDRLVEDFRMMGLVVGAAFEARVDRVNDRVDDYRRLLEKRRATANKKERTETEKRPGSSVLREFPNPAHDAFVPRDRRDEGRGEDASRREA